MVKMLCSFLKFKNAQNSHLLEKRWKTTNSSVEKTIKNSQAGQENIPNHSLSDQKYRSKTIISFVFLTKLQQGYSRSISKKMLLYELRACFDFIFLKTNSIYFWDLSPWFETS